MSSPPTPRADIDSPVSSERVPDGTRGDAAGQPAPAPEAGLATHIATAILEAFEIYYSEFRRIPSLARAAFENRDPGSSLHLSRERLTMYGESIEQLAPRLHRVAPTAADDEALWQAVGQRFLALIKGMYEADLAYAYMHSVRRKLSRADWRPVAYSFSDSVAPAANQPREIYRQFPADPASLPRSVAELLGIPGFTVPYRNLSEDTNLIVARIGHDLARRGLPPHDLVTLDIIDSGFYRNRGAYLVGRQVFAGGGTAPFILALLNDERGIYVDALLTRESDAHNIFSSTLANFHVTSGYYHEVCEFLHSIMPKRPLGLHYTTIGFNHFGKVAVMNELRDEIGSSGEQLEFAVGSRGTVAIGFSTHSSAYNMKIIRDKPTSEYKWGEFLGIESVLRKYGRVHEINRTGSMLDNIIYDNLEMNVEWIEPRLLEELLSEASQCVSVQGNEVLFKYLIVQRRLKPLPVFLETATEQEAEIAIVNLGHCIKNNAAADIFNKDLDARNYGVSRFSKIYLFDYDALEPFSDVKIRTNQDRVDGEEDVPDWFYEDGVIFLPEEIDVGLRIPSQRLRAVFREVHGDLLTTQYWERIQNDLIAGKVPSVRIYPESQELHRF